MCKYCFLGKHADVHQAVTFRVNRYSGYLH